MVEERLLEVSLSHMEASLNITNHRLDPDFSKNFNFFNKNIFTGWISFLTSQLLMVRNFSLFLFQIDFSYFAQESLIISNFGNNFQTLFQYLNWTFQGLTRKFRYTKSFYLQITDIYRMLMFPPILLCDYGLKCLHCNSYHNYLGSIIINKGRFKYNLCISTLLVNLIYIYIYWKTKR